MFDETIDVQVDLTDLSVRAENVIEKFAAGRETRRHCLEIGFSISFSKRVIGVKRDFQVTVVTENNK